MDQAIPIDFFQGVLSFLFIYFSKVFLGVLDVFLRFSYIICLSLDPLLRLLPLAKKPQTKPFGKILEGLRVEPVDRQARVATAPVGEP